MSHLIINGPPVDGRCQTCLRPEAELPPFLRAMSSPAHRLAKNYRGSEVISAYWECRDCYGLSDVEASTVRARAIVHEVAECLRA